MNDRCSEVTVVSGLPRSGTSMMMRMLEAGGVAILGDGQRRADEDNPRGYFELEAVKATARDASWLEAAAGKAVKVVSALLVDLPPAQHRYRVIFMRRDLGEVVASQAKMLERRGQAAPRESALATKELLIAHLAEVEAILRERADMALLFLSYNRAIAAPAAAAERVAAFLGGGVDVDRMIAAIEPALHRHRVNR